MKRVVIAAIVCLFAVFAHGQTVDVPYNPDSNSDQYIGMHDLLDLLPVFGSFYAPNPIQVNNTSLANYLDSLENAIHLMSNSYQNSFSVDTLFVENDVLHVQFMSGALQTFPLPVPLESIQVENTYEAQSIPFWMHHFKSSDDVKAAIGRALNAGFISSIDDFSALLNVVPEAIFSFPVSVQDTSASGCATDGEQYVVSHPSYFEAPGASYASSGGEIYDCSTELVMALDGVNLNGVEFDGGLSFGPYRLQLTNASAKASVWNLPSNESLEPWPHPNVEKFHAYPVHFEDSDLSHSIFKGVNNSEQYQFETMEFNWHNVSCSGCRFESLSIDYSTFSDCDMSGSVFYDIWYDNGDWGQPGSNFTGVTFRCMVDNGLQWVPEEWGIEPDLDCSSPDRVRFSVH